MKSIEDVDIDKIILFIEKLEELDDVQNIWTDVDDLL